MDVHMRANAIVAWLRRKFPGADIDVYPVRTGAAALFETLVTTPLGSGHHDVYRFRIAAHGFRHSLDVACEALDRFDEHGLVERLEWQDAAEEMRVLPNVRWILDARGVLNVEERARGLRARRVW